MDFITVITGIVILVGGWRARDTGAGIPLMVAGAGLALFGAVWWLAEHSDTSSMY